MHPCRAISVVPTGPPSMRTIARSSYVNRCYTAAQGDTHDGSSKEWDEAECGREAHHEEEARRTHEAHDLARRGGGDLGPVASLSSLS
jgi:hypothetical protein